MARLAFGMNQSLDGYVDHSALAPGPALFGRFLRNQSVAWTFFSQSMKLGSLSYTPAARA
jgi:hypothetical protein